MLDKFTNKRKNRWQRLEEILADVERSGLRNLPREEVSEFGKVYRRAASDLAIARAESRDPKLVNYLNSLVTRGHGFIYRAENHGVGMIWNFFKNDFPRAFRKNWKFILIAFLAFLIPGIFAFVLTWNDIEFASILGLGEIRYMVESDMHWWERLNGENQIGASAIMTNNIMVSIYSFIFGAFFCIGSLFYMAFNGAHIAAVLAVCYKLKPEFGNSLITFMVGHGFIELSCIFIAGGAGMMIGYAVLVPGNLSRTDALKEKGLEAIRLVIGCACLLVVAGTIEGFISPSSIDAPIKFGIGIVSGIAMYSYLLLAGRDQETK